jgi:hypothetical protein
MTKALTIATSAMGAMSKGITIPVVVVLIVPALMVLAGAVLITAVLVVRMVNRAIFTQDEVAICRLERLLKAGSSAMAEVLAAQTAR